MLQKNTALIKESTKQGYSNQIRALQNTTFAKINNDWENPAAVPLKDLIEDFILRTDISPDTKTTYRSALIWYLNSIESQSEEITALLNRLNDLVRQRGPKEKLIRPKTIPEKDFNLLLEEIQERGVKSIWAKRTAIWLVAGLSCGARPIEWLDASWSDSGKTILRIRTAKVKLMAPAFDRVNNRTPKSKEVEFSQEDYAPQDWDKAFESFNENNSDKDPFRYIPISNLIYQSQIETHMGAISSYIPPDSDHETQLKLFKEYYEQCRNIVYRACLKIWKGKKIYSLYTMRGQFSANMKALHGIEEATKLMGHTRSDSPAAASYGKSNQAHARFKGQRVGTEMVWKETESEKNQVAE